METPTIDNEKHQIVPHDGSPVDVPVYYDIALEGKTVSLTLNDNAAPQVTAGVVQTEEGEKSIPAIEVNEEGVASVGTTTIRGLYYALKSGTTLSDLTVAPDTKWVQGDGNVMQLTAPASTGAASGFYRVIVSDTVEIAE